MLLTITTPYMHGTNVRNVQTFLKQKGYLQGAVDGVFGPDTARAVYKAKYWLGYKPENLNQKAGDLFYSYLTGTRPLSSSMKARIADRKKAQGAVPLRMKMINEARKHVGVKENPPNSNRCQFTQWYGMIGPWCAMFVTFCGVTVGSKVFIRGQRYAYVPYIVNDARAGRNGIAVTYNPQEGDLVCYDWNGDGVADHVGFFDHWLDSGHTKFRAVEGNTATGNDSNGGQVMVRDDRYKSNVQAFVHVGG